MRSAGQGGGTRSPSAHAVGLARVRGASMVPVLRPGDRVLVRYGVAVRPGDLVLATLADGTLAVKRADSRRALRDGSPGWWLLSEDPEVGVDSRHRGPVPDARVHGVVRARLWPRPRWWGRPRRGE